MIVQNLFERKLKKIQQRIMVRKQKKYFCIASFLINILQLNRQLKCSLLNLYYDQHCNFVVTFDNQSIYNFIDNQIGLGYINYTLLNIIMLRLLACTRYKKTYKYLQCYDVFKYVFLSQTSFPNPIIWINELLKLFIKKDSNLFQFQQILLIFSKTLLNKSQRIYNIQFRRNEYETSNFQHQFNNNSNLFLCEFSNYQVLSELVELKQQLYCNKMMLPYPKNLRIQVLNLIDQLQKEPLFISLQMKDQNQKSLVQQEKIYLLQQRIIKTLLLLQFKINLMIRLLIIIYL
ncbi:unnamed protein product [Paramecium pentaurelia]|uniref:Transmembrane protein n=1 Tax=Paramecium pentaurelia TaxID=43138 RepID=A0A8S1UP73_9CILI|nr:unnamed protein product [Paramecium pentaurelia]